MNKQSATRQAIAKNFFVQAHRQPTGFDHTPIPDTRYDDTRYDTKTINVYGFNIGERRNSNIGIFEILWVRR